MDHAAFDEQHLEVDRHRRQRVCVVDLALALSLIPLNLKAGMMLTWPCHVDFVALAAMLLVR